MKKLNLNNVTDVFIESVNKTHQDLLDVLKDIKQEYNINMIDEKIKLLLAICNGEGLDFNEMKIKYLKSRELGNIELDDSKQNNFLIDDNLLDKIRINDKDYYYESVNNGIVYDTNSQQVGLYKNGTIVFNKI